MTTAALRTNILRAVKRMDGQPMTRESLDNTLGLIDRNLLGTEIAGAAASLEGDGYLVSVRDPLTETVNYSLTVKGITAAARL